MANMLLENGLAVLAFARRGTLAFLEDIPEDKLCYSPVPNGNHALWLIGHITLTDDELRSTVGSGPARCPEPWNKLFGSGTRPLPDPRAYPSLVELKQHLNARREELIGWFKSLPDAKLTEPLAGDLLQFAPNYAGLMPSIAYHEGLHAGQLRVIGQALGKPPKYG
ncbi:MAG: DinB family protein [Planctomycetota bacterium]